MNVHFDQPIILQRSPRWSRAVVWSIVGVTVFGVLWACIAKIEESVPATGKLEPQGAVKEVKVPLNGVVKTISVRDGQKVKQGDLLLTLDSTIAQAQLEASKKVRDAIAQENQYYRAVLGGTAAPTALNLSVGLEALTRSRSTLVEENRLYRAQLTQTSDPNFSAEQQLRLKSAQAESSSREASAQLETAQLERQLAQAKVQLLNAQNTLKINQQIYAGLAPIAREGAVSRIQILKQQQQYQTSQAEVAQFQAEAQRLELAIVQSQQKLQNTVAVSTQDTLLKIAENEKKIAEIDTQLNKLIIENEKKIAETDNQLKQTQVTLQYQEIRAPVDGTVFDLKATNPGFVANSAEPILKVVPDNTLQVEVFITNKDIGFVREGMPVDVRIDSFPFSEYGDVKGELLSVGSDALPPTEVRPVYTFPAKIRLKQNTLKANGRELALQSGMSVSVNIKVRDRPIISILTDSFTQQIESLKNVR
jgi:hemolysin D